MATDHDNIMALIAGTITSQGMAIAAQEIARELLYAWVSSRPDPQRELREIFSNVTARMDAQTDRGEKNAQVEAREYINLIFLSLDRRLQRKSGA